jgi:hypothetical protein
VRSRAEAPQAREATLTGEMNEAPAAHRFGELVPCLFSREDG